MHGEITRLLQGPEADDLVDRLLPLVYEELRRIAHAQRYPGDTLCTTALVHEAYLRLVGPASVPPQNRAHFFGAAARAMRFVLVDRARARKAAKRGAGQRPLDLDAIAQSGLLDPESCAEEVIAVHDALERLAALDERAARVVEARFFGGLTVDETAEAVGASERTVKRDWRRARAWLFRELYGEAA